MFSNLFGFFLLYLQLYGVNYWFEIIYLQAQSLQSICNGITDKVKDYMIKGDTRGEIVKLKQGNLEKDSKGTKISGCQEQGVMQGEISNITEP